MFVNEINTRIGVQRIRLVLFRLKTGVWNDGLIVSLLWWIVSLNTVTLWDSIILLQQGQYIFEFILEGVI